MSGGVALGVALVLSGGVLSGCYALPMTKIRVWAWENTWSVYCSIGAWIFPLVYCVAANAPNLGSILASPSAVFVALCGLSWGVSSVLFGICLVKVGQALTFGIILSIGSSVGSLLPLLVLSPSQAFSRAGICDWAGLVVAIVGVVLISWAGLTKEHERTAIASVNSPSFHAVDAMTPPGDDGDDDNDGSKGAKEEPMQHAEAAVAAKSRSTKIGILMCIIAGFTSLLPLGFALGDDMRARALDNGGATAFTASATVWFVALASGNLVNVCWPLCLLFRNRTWALFRCDGKGRVLLANLAIVTCMAVMWFGGMMLYGFGATAIGGTLGASLGWALFMCSQIVAANVCSVVAGEWTGTKHRSRTIMLAAVLTLLGSIAILAVGASFAAEHHYSSSS